MEKKLFYNLSDNNDLSGYILELDGAMEHIKNESAEMSPEDLKQHEWTIIPVFMTQEEFEALPEYQF